jgi:dipeptidyl aminopeptidase/acylaminoacyl peptidase
MTFERDHLWTMNQQIQYPYILETAISPEGTQVIYVVRKALMTDEKSEFISHLYLASSAGDEPFQLTFGEHANRAPRWSPDGRYIAFLSTRTGKANIHVMRADGGEAWALTSGDKGDIISLEWSPDGQCIAFLMPERPTESKENAQKKKDDPLRWDVDFDFVHLFRIPFVLGSREMPEVTQITQGRFHLLAFDWLPDAETIAVTHRPRPVDDDWTVTRLATVPAEIADDGKPHGLEEMTDISLVANFLGNVKASPDGEWLACATADRPVRWAFSSRIVLYPVSGGEPRPLARTPDVQSSLVGWSKDGSAAIVFDYDRVNTQLFALPISGEPAQPLTSASTVKMAFSASRSGAIAFSSQDSHRPNAVLVMNEPGVEAHEVAKPDMPGDWPDSPLPGVEVIGWQSADGEEVEGIVVYPLNYRIGRPYPLVVSVHGGPAGVFLRDFLGMPDRYCDTLGLAERGFVVLQPNPRGSSGYGKNFRFANQGDWGGGDYLDIITGVDHLIETGVVDSERMGIIGWSYGGFMTSWVITQTDRFKAACVGAGVTNLMSFNGTADIPGFVPDYFSAEYWEDLEPYKQHSALFQVKGVTTPTLIQHGAEDIRVPLSQGRELYNALKKQGVPVEMVIYPRQGHAVAEPRLKIDVRERAVAWLERWLLRGGKDGADGEAG